MYRLHEFTVRCPIIAPAHGVVVLEAPGVGAASPAGAGGAGAAGAAGVAGMARSTSITPGHIRVIFDHFLFVG